MSSPDFFLDTVLPICIAGGMGGFFILLILSRVLYDYVLRNYSRMLNPTESQSYFADQDAAMAFVGDIWALTRSGGFRAIESRFWRTLFYVNLAIGIIATLCLATLVWTFLRKA